MNFFFLYKSSTPNGGNWIVRLFCVYCDLWSLLLQCSSFVYIRNKNNKMLFPVQSVHLTLLQLLQTFSPLLGLWRCSCSKVSISASVWLTGHRKAWHSHCRDSYRLHPHCSHSCWKKQEEICIVWCLGSKWHPPGGTCDVIRVSFQAMLGCPH